MLPFEEETAVNEPELFLPNGKTSFKPEELYRFTKVKPFVLRFWESEFPSLTLKKVGSEGLSYSRADVELILSIKQLLYDEGLTLAEARRRLSGEEDLEAKKKTASMTGTKKRKKKTAAGKPAATSSGDGRVGEAKAAGAGVATSPKPIKVRDKRGLPGTETSRNTVSFEELLPDPPGGGRAAGPDRIPSSDPTAKKSVAAAEKGKAPKRGADPEKKEMRIKLSVALTQLREILTFLDKGDR